MQFRVIFGLVKHQDLAFNPDPPKILHVDINSCFASVEQQYDATLRYKPIAVAAYNSPGGCILAASIEAKNFGVKTGMRVREGRQLCPQLIVLESHPEKYREVHLKLRKVVETYTPIFVPKSIDEFVLDMTGCPAYKLGMLEVGRKLKKDITAKVGDYIRVSVGIGPNRFLAKTAAGLTKPDGLEEINIHSYLKVYGGLELTDLCGIARSNAARLGAYNIFTVLDFYNASLDTLKRVFQSIGGYYWFLRLRGWEIDSVENERRSFGNSYALPKPLRKAEELAPILLKLVEKTSFRLHRAGFQARGISVFITYREGGFWHKSVLLPNCIYESRDIFKRAYKILLLSSCRQNVRVLAVSCFRLESVKNIQKDLFGEVAKNFHLAEAVDKVNTKWGGFVLGPAELILTKNKVKDRISFGGVKEL